MKRKWWLAVACVCLAACSGTPQSAPEGECTIDVAGGMENLTELKLSDLGSEVRYVALETTDSSLIGRNPSILLLDKYIVVTTNKECFVFDKKDGKFLNRVGHAGEDPEAFSSAACTYSEAEGILYFKRGRDILQKYDLQGNYRGKVILPTPPTAPNDFVFTDSLIIGHYNGVAQQYNARSLAFIHLDGRLLDTIPSLLPVLPEKQITDILEISVKKLGLSSFVLSKFADGSYSAAVSGMPFLWKNGETIRFKECFNDTVYSVESTGLVPTIIFATGKWHWGAEARTDSRKSEERLLMTAVLETDANVFFQCIRGIYGDAPEVFNGIYNRQSGITCIGKEKDGIMDDLNGFMPFRPTTCSGQGEYGMIVESDRILEWLEENPEKAANEPFASLRLLTEDSNPVVLLTVP